MKKYLWILILTMLVLTPISFADEVSRTTADTCVSPNTCQQYINMYAQRAVVYNALNLTSEQIQSKNTIETKRFQELKHLYNELDQEEFILRKMKVGESSKTAIIKQQKAVRFIAEDIEQVNEKYDREFMRMLTNDQRSKYHNIERLNNREIKQSVIDNKREYVDTQMKKFGEK